MCPPPSSTPPQNPVGESMERNKNPDPREHIGFLTSWSFDMHRKKAFPLWSKEEILSEAYIQTHRLLTGVYKPEKSTVVTFLRGFLWGAVHYAYWTQNGYRFVKGKHILKLPLTNDIVCEDLEFKKIPPKIWDAPQLIGEDWVVVKMRTDGYTLSKIAEIMGLKSPQSVYNRLVRIRNRIQSLEDTDHANRNTPHPRPNPRTKGPRKNSPPIPGIGRPDPESPHNPIL